MMANLPEFEYLMKGQKIKQTWDNFEACLVNVVRCVDCGSILKEPNADGHICAQNMKGGVKCQEEDQEPEQQPEVVQAVGREF